MIPARKAPTMRSLRIQDSSWFNPIAPTVTSRFSRRRLVSTAGAAIALATVTPSLHVVAAQDATPGATPSSITGQDDAVAVVQEAANAMAALDTFTFQLETVAGESTVLSGLTLESISGKIRRPTDFEAVVSVGIPFGTIDVTAVGLDGRAWVQNPLEDGAWIDLGSGDSLLAYVNPDSLILASIQFVTDAEIVGTEKVDGNEATHVTGVVDLSRIAGFGNAQANGQLPTELAGEPVTVDFYIDGDHRVVEVEIAGPILTTESSDVVRAVTFADFNEPVEIQQPDV